jgi:hypothetical protein
VRRSQVPLSLSLGPLTTLSAGLGQAPRLGKGINYRPSKKPEKPIELWVRLLKNDHLQLRRRTAGKQLATCRSVVSCMRCGWLAHQEVGS